MKLFNTVQELWSYCAFCPLCQDVCRDIIVDVAMDSDRNLRTSYEKKDQFLHIKCEQSSKSRSRSTKRSYSVISQYVIDCMQNTFTVQFLPDTPVNAYCYIQSMCEECAYTFVYGSDMELHANSQKVLNIGLDREHIELSDETHRYNLNFYYSNDVPPGIGLFVEREEIDCEYDKDRDRGIKLPLMTLDFSVPKKVIDKLKTLILFS